MSNGQASPRIVVGVDGSPPSLRALHWALDQAALTHAVAGVERAVRRTVSRICIQLRRLNVSGICSNERS